MAVRAEIVNAAIGRARFIVKAQAHAQRKTQRRQQIAAQVASSLGVLANQLTDPTSQTGQAQFVDGGVGIMQDGYSAAYQYGVTDGFDDFNMDDGDIDQDAVDAVDAGAGSGDHGFRNFAIAAGIVGLGVAVAAWDDIKAAAEDQRDFLTGLYQDFMSSDNADAFASRFDLYGGTTQPFYEQGYGDLASSQGADQIIWHVTDDEACDLCLERDDQTYTEDDLPGYPGDGDFGELCDGGPNCRCWLEWVTGDDTAEAAARPTLLKYSEDQPRDAHGRFGEGGGGGAYQAPGKTAAEISGNVPTRNGVPVPVETRTMYHVTTVDNARAILKNGFDLSRVKPRWQNDKAVSVNPGLKRARNYFMTPQQAKDPTARMPGNRVALEVVFRGRFTGEHESIHASSPDDYTRQMVGRGWDAYGDRNTANYIYNPQSIISIRPVGPEADALKIVKGDVVGHPFRGNQYSDGEGGQEFASPTELAMAQQQALDKIKAAPRPTGEMVEANLRHIAEQSRAGGDMRGSSKDRAARTVKLLHEFGDGHHAPCVYCGRQLDSHTLTQDKIYTARQGGRYRMENLLPACLGCNQHRNDMQIAAGARRPLLTKSAIIDAVVDAAMAVC